MGTTRARTTQQIKVAQPPARKIAGARKVGGGGKAVSARKKPRYAEPSWEESNRQFDDNLAVFETLKYPKSETGKYALMRNGKVVKIMDTWQDARDEGLRRYKYKGNFSFHEINAKPIYIGVRCYGRPVRDA